MIDKTKFVAREILALVFWIYLITKLFIFDFDIYLLEQYVPQYSFILDYKYFVLIPAISFYWIIAGNTKFFRNIGYIAFYPFIYFLWKIPKSLFQSRNWFLIFTYINSAISFLKSFKINLFLLSIFSISTVLIIKSTNEYLITLGAVALTFLLVYHFYQKFYFAFNPTTAFAVDAKTLQNSLESETFTRFLLPDKNDSENGGSELNEKGNNKKSLENLVLYSGIFKFIATRLKRFQKTKIYILFFVLGLVFTLFLSSTILTFANYSLFKIDPTNFTLNKKPSFTLFFYYSFNTIFSNQIHEIIPDASSTRILSMVGIFLGLLILAILISIYFSTKTVRYQEELNKMIVTVDQQDDIIETHISNEYNLSFEQALIELENIESAFHRFLYHLAEGIQK